MTHARVVLWGRQVGAVSVAGPGEVAEFEYDPDFRRSGIEVAPLMMPLEPKRIHRFPALPYGSFHGLPGMLADALPDRFGSAVLDAWLATQGRLAAEIDVVERLCYTGSRAMGALEFAPAAGPDAEESAPLQLDALRDLAGRILSSRGKLQVRLDAPDRERAMLEILRVGTSAGGARAKAVIAWNPSTDEVRSGQLEAPAGFEHWLLKFDGVSGNADRDIRLPLGYGAIEYAYSLMARAAGIRMEPCRLYEENGRRHFMTRRFDRLPGGGRLHLQSLAALLHLDYNAAGAHSYEQALLAARRLELGMDALEELFRRMCFNVVARNQDDHVKNIAFLMDRGGRWKLAPAYDLTWAYNPDGDWTSRHQMSLAGKREGFTRADFEAVGESASLRRGHALALLDEVREAVRGWPHFAAEAAVDDERAAAIAATHRLAIPD